jgi:hypothetical protein
MEGSLDDIERIVDNSNGLSDGRAGDVASGMLYQSQVEFSTISAETMTQYFLFIRSDDAERPEHHL